MRWTASPHFERQKATWGSRVGSWAVIVLCIAAPALAAPRHKGQTSKLDIKLEERAKQPTGESDVIIEFTDDTRAVEVIKGFGKAGRKLGILKAFTAKVPNHALGRLAASGLVKKVSLDRAVATLNGRTAITIGARTVQELSGYTGSGIGVAVIDSGVVGFHDDLTIKHTSIEYQAQFTWKKVGLFYQLVVTYVPVEQTTYSGQRVAHFADFIGGAASPYDDFGHGTHVAGTIAGNGHASSEQRKAVAPGASIIALKALDGQGRGTISSIIAAIDYAIAVKDVYNIRVMNLSLGAGVYESYETDPLTVAAKRAVDSGIVVVAAAGNLGKASDGSPQYGAITAPANAPWVLTVGASSTQGTADRVDDIIGNYSSRGPTMIDYIAKPDLVAPGTGTVSMSAPGSLLYNTKPNLLLTGLVQTATGLMPSSSLPYMSLTGTSMSAPVVAGTVALMLQANPNLTPNLVKAILQFTSESHPDYNWLTQGAGFLNSRGAVQLAEYFATHTRGTPYPDMTGWSRHIAWGNRRVSGGVITPGGTAWGANVVWGNLLTPSGDGVVWGENCPTSECDNVVWGNSAVWGASDGADNVVWGNTDADNVVWGNGDDDNVVWGNGDADNVVWGNSDGDNVVWGNDCQGDDCDNVVWGNADGDNVVWGNAADGDNVVWGNCTGDGCDNVVWGNDCSTSDPDCDNVVWGNSYSEMVFGDESADVDTFDPLVWDDLFKVTAHDQRR